MSDSCFGVVRSGLLNDLERNRLELTGGRLPAIDVNAVEGGAREAGRLAAGHRDLVDRPLERVSGG
jgi:hypothetical protein